MVDHKDAAERIVPIDLGVKIDAGAPIPILLRSESRSFVLAFLADFDESRDRYVIIEWLHCYDIRSGAPDEDYRTRHNLYDIGLLDVPWGTGEVLNSRWPSETGWDDPLDPEPRTEPGSRVRHFVVQFHDSTIECLAEGYRVETTSRPFMDVMIALAEQIDIQRDRGSPEWPVIGNPVVTYPGPPSRDRRRSGTDA